MSNQLPFAAIIVAAGVGQRAGLPLPKQYMSLGGMPVLRWSVECFARHSACRAIIVVTGDAQLSRAALAHLEVQYAEGGATRQQSVAAGLALCPPALAVLVHDAARPGLRHATIDALLSALAQDRVVAAVPALPLVDSLANADEKSLGASVDRSALLRIQTPQAFHYDALIAAHQATDGIDATDDAQLVRAIGGTVQVVPGDELLEKITAPGDLERLERLLVSASSTLTEQQSVVRVGNGFDVHRLVAGKGLWLCGHFIEHSQSLLGHSDADVGLHAITDALLGAIGAGDIGEHFPPSDPQWRGASSDRFLAHAAKIAAFRGYVISNIDCTLICETPKIGPHREAMRVRLAEILQLGVDCISIKATTTERLGFTGRSEGIAALASVAVTLQCGG